MKIILILSLIFFFGTSQEIFANNECSNESILEYFSTNEKFSEADKKKLVDFISKKQVLTTDVSSDSKKISDDDALE